MGKNIIGILIVIITGGLIFFLTKPKNTPPAVSPTPTQSTALDPTTVPQEVAADYEASFAIFTHGTFRVFTAAMYHNLSSDVFIRASNPNIVLIKKSGVTWDSFFKTLPFKLTRDCLTTGTGQTFCTGQGGTLKFYLNGVRDNDLLDKTINAGDQALISFGNESDTQIQTQIKQIPKSQ